MAYQPKSYRKFVATAATATLVASAIAPVAGAASNFEDVAPKYKDAVDYLVNNNITQGTTPTTFGTHDNIKRGDLAIWLAKALKLDTASAPASGFEDTAGTRYDAAVSVLKAKGIVSGKSETSYAPSAYVTRGEMAIMLSRAYELSTDEKAPFTDMGAYAPYINGLYAYEITTGKTPETFGTALNITRGDLAIFLKRAAEVVKEVKVESVAAAGAKKFEVKFNSAVDTSKASITVKKGTSNVAVSKVTFSDDKKTAVVEMNSKLTEGKYTVTVSGVTKEAVSKEVEVGNEKVAGLELLSTTALMKDADTVEVGYKVVNQYGEDITSSTGMYELVPTATNGFVVTSTTSGKVSLDKSGVKSGDTFTLTLIDKNSANSVSKVVTVSDKAVSSDVAIEGVYNAKGLTLNEDNKTEDFYLTVNVKDQYGNAISNADQLNNELLVTVSNPGVADAAGFTTYEDAAKKKHTALKLDPKVAGESIITIVSKANGKAVSYKVTVEAGVKLDVVSLGAPNGLVAGGDTALLPLSVTDNKGNAITDAKKVDGKLVFSGSGYESVKVITKDGNLFAEVEVAETASQTSLVLTVQSQTNKYDTEVVTVKPTAVADAIIGLKSAVSTSIYAGESVTLQAKNFVIQDQYGREMNTASADFTATITAADTASETLEVSGLTITAGEKKGTESVTFALAGVTGSATDVTFRVVDRSEFVSYEVADVPNLYANGAEFNYSDAYAQKLVVNGVTADGKKVKLPADEFTVYETSSYLGHQNGVLDAKADTDLTKTYEGTVDVIVTINATGQELKKQVTVSEAAPKVSTVEVVRDDKAVTSIDYVVADDATPGFSKADITGVVVTDTYGVENDSLAVIDRVTFTNIKEKEGTDINVNANGTSSAALSGLAAGDTFDATFVVGGKAVKLAVTVK